MEKYVEGEMMDLFLIMHLHSRTFCLERPERRVGQFKSEMTRDEEADLRFVHNLAANPWMDSNLSKRVMEGGVPNTAAVIKLGKDQGLAQL